MAEQDRLAPLGNQEFAEKMASLALRATGDLWDHQDLKASKAPRDPPAPLVCLDLLALKDLTLAMGAQEPPETQVLKATQVLPEKEGCRV